MTGVQTCALPISVPPNLKGTCHPALSAAGSFLRSGRIRGGVCGVRGLGGRSQEDRLASGCQDQQSCQAGTPWQIKQGPGTNTRYREPEPLGAFALLQRWAHLFLVPAANAPCLGQGRVAEKESAGTLGAGRLGGVRCYLPGVLGAWVPFPLGCGAVSHPLYSAPRVILAS